MSTLDSISRVEGLEQYEIAGLVAVAEEVNDPEDGISIPNFRENMEQAGFTKLAGTLAMKSLIDKGMLERFTAENSNGYEYTAYTALRVTSEGMGWLSKNKENLALKIRKDEVQKISAEDIPF